MSLPLRVHWYSYANSAPRGSCATTRAVARLVESSTAGSMRTDSTTGGGSKYPQAALARTTPTKNDAPPILDRTRPGST